MLGGEGGALLAASLALGQQVVSRQLASGSQWLERLSITCAVSKRQDFSWLLLRVCGSSSKLCALSAPVHFVRGPAGSDVTDTISSLLLHVVLAMNQKASPKKHTALVLVNIDEWQLEMLVQLSFHRQALILYPRSFKVGLHKPCRTTPRSCCFSVRHTLCVRYQGLSVLALTFGL